MTATTANLEAHIIKELSGPRLMAGLGTPTLAARLRRGRPAVQAGLERLEATGLVERRTKRLVTGMFQRKPNVTYHLTSLMPIVADALRAMNYHGKDGAVVPESRFMPVELDGMRLLGAAHIVERVSVPHSSPKEFGYRFTKSGTGVIGLIRLKQELA